MIILTLASLGYSRGQNYRKSYYHDSIWLEVERLVLKLASDLTLVAHGSTIAKQRLAESSWNVISLTCHSCVSSKLLHSSYQPYTFSMPFGPTNWTLDWTFRSRSTSKHQEVFCVSLTKKKLHWGQMNKLWIPTKWDPQSWTTSKGNHLRVWVNSNDHIVSQRSWWTWSLWVPHQICHLLTR